MAKFFNVVAEKPEYKEMASIIEVVINRPEWVADFVIHCINTATAKKQELPAEKK